ncbi:MAG: phosphate ABC transporter permease subunit PstC [Nitrospinae bacterium]|nr:phosphate ABC transporter permease subunit PstC [Nitrospinota bacterium]MBL7020907.1 phosphate ABC transporter permease subunit PstC [Nitrospinaceae bacterium]
MTFIFLVCAMGLGIFLVVESVPVLRSEGLGFWLGENWWVGESFGALPMICGSLIVTGLAIILVLPVALSGALFTSEYLPPSFRRKVKGVMELLAGVPGIIYGLLGVSFLTVGVKDALNLLDGNTLFTAGLLLAIMVLPTVLTLSEDALHSVSSEFREVAESLGLTKLQTALRVVLPQALPGIVGAVLLGIGRAMGETIAVMLVIGSLDRVPGFNIFVSGQTIPSKLGREAAEALGSGLHWNALMGLGLTLFIMVAILTFSGTFFIKRSSQ